MGDLVGVQPDLPPAQGSQTGGGRALLGGFVVPGLEAVREEFECNFVERGEVGAAFAAFRDGEPIVDLWGGVADSATGRPWESDTMQCIYSGSKGLVAICMLMVLERGLLELEAPIARYWPEFAQAGKEEVRVRDAVAHTARMPGLAVEVTWQEATDDRRMAELLAAQPQSDDPRAASSYHALTYGWLCGELVRRVDGRSIGRFFAEEVAGPLELELWIGLPEALEPRVATLEAATTWDLEPLLSEERLAADPLVRSIVANPVRFTAGNLIANEREWHAAEVPASNAIGTARSIARLYDSLDRLLRPATIELGRTPLSTRFNALTGVEASFGVGFALQTADKPLGPPADAFGHDGAGGSRHGRWPTQRIGFSYAMNLMRDDAHDQPGRALMTALHAGLAGMEAMSVTRPRGRARL